MPPQTASPQTPATPVPPPGRGPATPQAPTVLQQALVLLREQQTQAGDSTLSRFATHESPAVAPTPGSMDIMIHLIERSRRLESNRRRPGGSGSVTYR